MLDQWTPIQNVQIERGPDPISEFLDAMRAAGICPMEPIADKLASGDPVRFRADGDKPGRRNGWAWLHVDGVPAGVFRHYRLGVRTVWRAGSNLRSPSPAERRAIMAQARESEARRKAETEAKQEAAAGVARDLWRGAGTPDPAHGYRRNGGRRKARCNQRTFSCGGPGLKNASSP